MTIFCVYEGKITSIQQLVAQPFYFLPGFHLFLGQLFGLLGDHTNVSTV